MRIRSTWVVAVGVWLLVSSPCMAQHDEPEKAAGAPAGAESRQAPSTETPPAAFRLGAYAEAYYQWNFNRPSNGITNYRGFDNRHNTFTLSNIALDAQLDYQNVVGRLTLQVGSTPSTYYLSEPARAGSTGANATDLALWKYLQQAYVGYRFLGSGEDAHQPEDAHQLTLTAGLFLAPLGPESMAVHENWNWSRSNLFFGCPFYYTGARGTYVLAGSWAFTVAVYNGWNSVVDNNTEKSVSGQLQYTRADLSASLVYFGGVERSEGSPEGRPWRNLFDAHVRWDVLSWLSLLAHGDAGFEHNRFGTQRWAAGALYARARALRQLFIAVRGDAFHEQVPSNARGRASPLFWPVRWVYGGTFTLDYRPHERVSFKAEYRHDHASGDMFFGGPVRTDPARATFIANRRAQDTVTVGATAWF